MPSEHKIDALDEQARFDASMAEIFAFLDRLKNEAPVSAPTPPPAASAPDAGTLAGTPPPSHAAAPAPGASVVDTPVLRPPTKVAEATVWLRARLAYGPVPATHVYAAAALAGIARRTLERAKRLLGARSEVDRRATPRRRWCWRLPGSRPGR